MIAPVELLASREWSARVAVIRSPNDPGTWGRFVQAVREAARAQVLAATGGRLRMGAVEAWVDRTVRHQVNLLASENRKN